MASLPHFDADRCPVGRVISLPRMKLMFAAAHWPSWQLLPFPLSAQRPAVTGRRLRARGEVPRAEPAGPGRRRRRRAELAARRPLLVSQPDAHRHGDRRRRSREEGAGVVPGLRGRRASTARRRRRTPADAAGAAVAADAAAAAAVRPRPTASRSRVARRHARRLHPRLESLGARHRDAARRRALTTDGVKYFGYATDNAGWSAQRSRDRARGRPTRRRSPRSSRTSATSARCTSSTPSSAIPTLRVSKFPLPGDQRHGDAPPRRHRRRHRQGHAAADAARLPSRHARRRHQHERLQLEPGRLEARARVGRRAITSTSWLRVADTATGRRAHGVRRDRARRSSSRAPDGACSGRRTRSSGTPSATTGASSISTICRPAS